ncbi:hypothetical protein [Flavobacterium piscinae]|uniref:hypothetical protein n=1 Tax=Flavobacterium piscinae TaxID=2506424 RepID=UPI002AAB1A44|nr:hypothetical protein [Flavobacterium piscinae]
MGGFHTIIISANYPKTFDYMGVFSAALFQPKEADSEMYVNIEKSSKLKKRIIINYIGKRLAKQISYTKKPPILEIYLIQ